jgi:hypothetical protein
MMSISYATQLRAGYIISQIINGLLSITNYNNGRTSLQNQNQDQPEDVSLQTHPLREYNVTLSSGEVVYILARSPMQAAYGALELAEERNVNLINVQITDEW